MLFILRLDIYQYHNYCAIDDLLVSTFDIDEEREEVLFSEEEDDDDNILLFYNNVVTTFIKEQK